MALMLADKRIGLWQLPTKPANPASPTIAEIAAGVNVACKVFKADTYLRATDSATINDPLLCGGAASAFGESAYEGRLAVARFLDSAGIPVEEEDVLWEAVREKGTTLWFAHRAGPVWDAAPAAKQEFSIFEVITDNAQAPQTYDSYIKKIVPLAVQNAWLDRVLAAAA